MIYYYGLMLVCLMMVGCEKKSPIEPVEKVNYPQVNPKFPNPASTPIEKPNIHDEFYDAPKM